MSEPDPKPDAESPPAAVIDRWRWPKRVGLALFALVGVHLLGDAFYAAYVAASIDAYEASVERDPSGVLAGCDAYDLPPSGDAPAGVALLLVHGLNASPRHYDLLAPALAERGHHCRVMRLPGFAEPVHRYRESRADDWLAAVAEELAALRNQHERVGLVAHSLGGATAIGVLLDDPDAADFAVLLAPAVAVSCARSPLLSARGWHEVSDRTLLFTRVLKSPYEMDCRAPGRTDHVGRGKFTPKSIVGSLFELIDSNGPRAASFVTPFTMILSSDDPIVDTPAAQRYYAAAGTTDKELIVLERSGHALLLDQEWETVVEAIDRRAIAGEGNRQGRRSEPSGG